MALDKINNILGSDLSKFINVDKADIEAILGQTAGFGPVTYLTDDFDDDSIDPTKWDTPGGSTAETGGELVITGAASEYLRTRLSYNLAGKTISIQFVDDPAPSSGYSQQFRLAHDDTFSNGYLLQTFNGTLYLQGALGAVLFSTAYDDVNHSFKRFRFISGTTYLDASPDGISWTNLFSEATSVDISDMYVFLRSNYISGGSVTFKWDNFVTNIPYLNPWLEAGSSPSSQPAGTVGNHRLTLFWKRASGGDADLISSVTASGQIGQVIAIRGCATLGNPFEATSSSQTTSTSLSATIPGVTTTVNDCLILAAINTYGNSSAYNAWYDNWVNAGLASVTERMDQADLVGGFGLATGGLATAGASGNTTVDVANGLSKTFWCGALKSNGGGIPTVVGVGAYDSGFGAISPPNPAGFVAGDILVVLFATRDEAITIP